MDSVRQLIMDTRKLESASDASGLLASLVKELGFEFYAFVTLRNVSGYDGASECIYSVASNSSHHKFATKSPLFEHVTVTASETRVPFSWQIEETNTDGLSEGLAQYLSEMGICQGMTLPIYGPAQEVSVLVVGTQSNSAPQDLLRAQCGSLYIVGIQLHALALEQWIADIRGELADLTKRELEVLSWAAQGKTNWEIGQIINRTEATVNFHVQRSIRKLNAVNKCHAVAKAAYGRVIRVTDSLVERQAIGCE